MEAKLQVPAQDWLKVHGLDANGLMLDQILPCIGFRQSKGEVGSTGKEVSSQYGDGVFVRQENSSGEVYNICGNSDSKLSSIEEELKDEVGLLKARYDWMTTESRLKFGVVCERHVVMVIDYHGTEHAQLKSLIDIAISVIKEQFVHLDQFNIISCSSGVSSWKDGLVSVTDRSIEEAVEWVEQTTLQAPPLTSNILPALSKALEHTEADSVYLLSYRESSLKAFDQLLERVKPSLIPVSVSVINCNGEDKLEQYKSLASASGGRFHSYTPPPQLTHNGLQQASFSSLASSISSRESGRSGNAKSRASRPSSAAVKTFLPPGLTDADTLAVWEELEAARNTLAQMQALHIELGGVCYCPPDSPSPSDDSMTSEQWLGEYGLRANKLMFEDLVQSLAFRHCNGTVRVPLPPKHKRPDKVEMISHTKVVHAQYCKDFVHMRWPEGGVIHIQLSKHAHRVFCEGVESVVDVCRQRLSWLKAGSRELFGTLLETKIVIVVDTSVSMANKLGMLKEKLQQLIQEQLSNKDQFTVFHFNSKVYPWRDSLVASSPQTLSAVSQWVDGLTTGGSTNTQAALVKAITVRGAQAVYLMTDGRPDTPTDVLLAKIQQLPKIPVHTISFNCADSKANHFLAKLASNTGGRYHYLSEDVSDPEGPKTYQSKDITRLEEEIKCGLEQIERANQLLAQCQVTRRRCINKKKETKSMKKIEDLDTDSGSGESVNLKPLTYSKKWLTKNSLASLKLTLMDALGPSSIPHNSKHVPLLQKDVHSKVFSKLYPLAHISSGNQMTLIHPNGVNLLAYEKQLEEQVGVYQTRLSKLSWTTIPADKRPSVLEACGLVEGEVPSYSEHRDILRRFMEELRWPRPPQDFDLLEEEIRKAETYHQYSQSLREEAKRPHEDELTVTSGGSHVPLMDNPLRYGPGKGRSSKPSKSAKVIVRSKVDGFYYPGVVVSESSKKSTCVLLANSQEVESLSSFVIPIGGARPCPVLHRGDHTLVRVRTSRNGRHPGPDGRCDYYIPGVVQVLPENERKGHALHSVLVFNGRVVMCDRRGIVKVSERRYTDTCKYIRQKVKDGTEPADSDESRSSISYSYSEPGRSSIRMPTPPESDHESDISSAPSTARHSESVRSKSRASNASSVAKAEPVVSGLDLSSLMEHQRAQQELIQQYREELLSMQEKQKEMADKLAIKMSKEKDPPTEVTPVEDQGLGDASSPHFENKPAAESDARPSSEDLDDFPDEEGIEPSTSNNQVPQTIHQAAATDNDPQVSDSMTEVTNELQSTVTHSEAAVNTDIMTEERGTGTGPMTESVAVGTEWSETEGSSEDEPDIGADSDKAMDEKTTEEHEQPVEKNEANHEEQLLRHTPIPTPAPTPPLSRASTPELTHQSVHVTPTPSEHDILTSPTPAPEHSLPTPSHSHSSSTPSQSHNTSPTHSQISKAEAKTALSHHSVVLTPQFTPLHISMDAPPLINQQVLARWLDDGWYYRCTVVSAVGEGQWEVKDASGDVEVLPSCDIITDLVDSQRSLELGDCVAALHPDYTCSYAPGLIAGVSSDGLSYTVELYDENQTVLPRHEVYRLAKSKHSSDVDYIRKKEAEWVGVACVARNNDDGLYYPGKVESQLQGTRRYMIEWADGSSQEQEVYHMYGQLTRKRPIRIGDHVIALADPKVGACMPGVISGTKQGQLEVEFCDGQSDSVDPTHCFWVSKEYHQQAVEYICTHALPLSDEGRAHTEDELSAVDTDNVLDSSGSGDYS